MGSLVLDFHFSKRTTKIFSLKKCDLVVIKVKAALCTEWRDSVMEVTNFYTGLTVSTILSGYKSLVDCYISIQRRPDYKSFGYVCFRLFKCVTPKQVT